MPTRIKYVYQHHDTWMYRRTYPKPLQPLLGFALKQSLRTRDPRVAKSRVQELNATYASIVSEAEKRLRERQQEVDASTPLPVSRPTYKRLSLMGERTVSSLAEVYLRYQSQRLRYGSYKSVRFAMELLTSHVGHLPVGGLSLKQGKDILSLLSQLSPNVRKYSRSRGRSLEELAALSQTLELATLLPQTQARIWEQLCAFLDWAEQQEELERNPWRKLKVEASSEPHPYLVLTDAQVVLLLRESKGTQLYGPLLFGLLAGLRSGEIVGLTIDDIRSMGNLGRFVSVRPNAHRLLKTRFSEREVPLHRVLEDYLDTRHISAGKLFPELSVDAVARAYAKLREVHPELSGTVFHSTRKWFVTQCERTGVPEHYAATVVGHSSARSANRLTYGLYSGGILDEQKRAIVDGLSLPTVAVRDSRLR